MGGTEGRKIDNLACVRREMLLSVAEETWTVSSRRRLLLRLEELKESSVWNALFWVRWFHEESAIN